MCGNSCFWRFWHDCACSPTWNPHACFIYVFQHFTVGTHSQTEDLVTELYSLYSPTNPCILYVSPGSLCCLSGLCQATPISSTWGILRPYNIITPKCSGSAQKVFLLKFAPSNAEELWLYAFPPLVRALWFCRSLCRACELRWGLEQTPTSKLRARLSGSALSSLRCFLWVQQCRSEPWASQTVWGTS